MCRVWVIWIYETGGGGGGLVWGGRAILKESGGRLFKFSWFFRDKVVIFICTKIWSSWLYKRPCIFSGINSQTISAQKQKQHIHFQFNNWHTPSYLSRTIILRENFTFVTVLSFPSWVFFNRLFSTLAWHNGFIFDNFAVLTKTNKIKNLHLQTS